MLQSQGLLSTVISDFIHALEAPTGPTLYGTQPEILEAIMDAHADTYHAVHAIKACPHLSPNTVRSVCYDLCVKGYAIKAGQSRIAGTGVRYQLYKLTPQAHAWYKERQKAQLKPELAREAA